MGDSASATPALATMMNPLTFQQYQLVYNFTSFGLAAMGASTIFFFSRMQSFNEKYKPALSFTGLVTLIAMYHYFHIFNSFEAAFTPCKVTAGKVDYSLCNAEVFGYTATGIPFNDAYRYVDWLLTVPLLLIEIVLVMKLSEAETVSKCTQLGISSALMIAFGYPGESSGDAGTRWLLWSISMCPFLFIVFQLFVGLKGAQDAEEDPAVKSQVQWACWATVISWCTYPIVYILPMIAGSSSGKAGLSAEAVLAVQVGYTISDVVSKCGVGYLVYRIGLTKSIQQFSGEGVSLKSDPAV